MCASCGFRVVWRRNKKARNQLKYIELQLYEVEVRGFEPLASCMPCKRSTN